MAPPLASHDVYEAISTHRDGGWGQDDIVPQDVCG